MNELTPMAIENPPALTANLTPQEAAVLNGNVRAQMRDAATMNGGVMGAVAGLLIGGIWSFITKSKPITKTASLTALGGALGAFAGRSTFNKQFPDEIPAGFPSGLPQLPVEPQAQQPAAPQPQAGQAPVTQIHADSVALLPGQDKMAPSIGIG